MDINTCTAAAMGYHSDVLLWAINNDCPYEVNDDTRPAFEFLGLA